MNTQIEKKICVFETAVSRAFQFLTDEYGMVKQKIKRVDFEYPKDRMVALDYFGEKVSVIIQWYLIDANISVGIVESTKGRVPEKYSFYDNEKGSRAISLTDLVSYVTKNRDLAVLPEAKLGASIKETVKAWKKRDEILTKNMNEVVVSFASLLRTYASDILNGDVSVFAEVQTFSKKELNEK